MSVDHPMAWATINRLLSGTALATLTILVTAHQAALADPAAPPPIARTASGMDPLPVIESRDASSSSEPAAFLQGAGGPLSAVLSGNLTSTGAQGILATSESGPISVVTNGFVRGKTGIETHSAFAPITVLTSETVTGDFGSGIWAETPHDIKISPNGAVVSTEGGDGIFAHSTFGGSIRIEGTGDVSARSGNAISAFSDYPPDDSQSGESSYITPPTRGEAASLAATGDQGGDYATTEIPVYGEITQPVAGKILIGGTGNTWSDNGVGIAVSGESDVQITRSGTVNGFWGGIAASGKGAVLVRGVGDVDSQSGTAITAYGTDAVSVIPAGHITGWSGIDARSSAGNVSVETVGAVVSTGPSSSGSLGVGGESGSSPLSYGIFADTRDGHAINIETGGTVDAQGSGVIAVSDSGAISIFGNDKVTSAGSSAIWARTQGLVNIYQSGAVDGARGGILAQGSSVFITANGAVNGGSGAGIGTLGQAGEDEAPELLISAGDVSGETGVLAFSPYRANIRITTEGVVAGHGSANLLTAAEIEDGVSPIVIGAGISATAESGSVAVEAKGVVSGTSAGIDALSLTGPVTVTTHSSVTGGAYGIRAISGDTVSVHVTGGTVSAEGIAIYVDPPAATVTIDSGATVTGAVGVFLDSGALGVSSGSELLLTNNGTILGSSTAVISSPGGGGSVTIANAGIISGPVAIDVQSGTAFVDNAPSGTISGSILAAGGTDVIFDNRGTYLAYGTDVQAGSGGGSFTFNNLGRIVLSGNGSTADRLTITGSYDGGPDSSVGLDVDTSSGQSDRINIAGTATGKTTINITPRNGPTALTSPLPLITVGGSTSSVFRLRQGAFGPYVYRLVEIGPNSFGLASTFTATPLQSQLVKAPAAVTAINVGFFEPVTSFISSPADPGVNQISVGPWIQLAAGQNDITESGTSIKTKADFAGFRVGGDVGLFNINGSGWNAHAGLMAGVVEARLDQSELSSSGRFSMPFLGAYLAASWQGLTADLAIRQDFASGHVADSGAGIFSTPYKFDSTSISGAVGYQFIVTDKLYVQPLAGFIWARTAPGDLPIYGAVFQQPAFDSTLGRVGVKVGTAMNLNESIAISPYLQGSIWHEFSGGVAGVYSTPGGEIIPVRAGLEGTFYQVGGGFSFRSLKSELVGFLRADLRFGPQMSGAAVNTGMRYQF